MIVPSFWKGRKVFITGHTGFKGSWLSIWLKMLGADVIGYSLEPNTKKDNFVVTNLEKKVIHNIGDVRDHQNLFKIFSNSRFLNFKIFFDSLVMICFAIWHAFPKPTIKGTGSVPGLMDFS